MGRKVVANQNKLSLDREEKEVDEIGGLQVSFDFLDCRSF